MTGVTASAERPLGFLMCTALVVGNTIGIGIFMMPAALAPYGLNALGAWLITAGGCLMVAWVFAGLARTFADDDAHTRRAEQGLDGGGGQTGVEREERATQRRRRLA